MRYKRFFLLSLLLSLTLMTSCDLKIREIYTAEDESFRIRYDKNCELKDMMSFDDIPYMGDIGENGIIIANESYEKGYIANTTYTYFAGSSNVSKEILYFKSLGYLEQLGFMKNLAESSIKADIEKINGRNYLILHAPFYDGTLGSFISAMTYKDDTFYQFVYYERQLAFSGDDLFSTELYENIYDRLYKDIKKVQLESVGQSWISSTFIGYIHGYFTIVRWPFTWFTERTVYDDWSKAYPGWYKAGFILGIVSLISIFFKRKKE